MPAQPDPFLPHDLRERELFNDLSRQPPVTLLALVSPSGAGGSQSHGQQLWTLAFTCDAWRIEDHPVRTDPLTVRRQVTREELNRLMRSIKPGTILRVQARVLDQTAAGAHALLEHMIGPDASDAELNAVAAELQKPVTHEDPLLGTLTLDRRFNLYTAEPTWNDRPVKLHLSAETPEELTRALVAARALWSDQAGWTRRIADYAVEKLLPLKNENWLADDDEYDEDYEGPRDTAPLAPDQFRARMTLESITVDPDGSFEFWHDDGDLFLGHAIQITGTLADGPTDAGIPG